MYLERQSNKGNISSMLALPAPTMGWNTKDNLSIMDVLYATDMVNMYPDNNKVVMRKGYVEFNSATNSKTLIEYRSGTKKHLIVAEGDKLYRLSASGSRLEIGSGFSSDAWEGTNFLGNLILCNGVDAPQRWNGSTLSPADFFGDGLNPQKLDNVIVYNDRIYFSEKNTGNFWYGDVQALDGELFYYPVSGVAELGGNITCMGTWSPNTGAGITRFVVFIMDSGETLIYSGDDPDSTDWQIVGRYKIASPLGKRCVENFGSDFIVLTMQGLVPLSKVINELKGEEITLSDKIDPILREKAAEYKNMFGWQVVYFAEENKIFLNVPVSNSGQEYNQYVFNTLSQAWCRYEDINVNSIATFNGGIYFNKYSGGIYKGETSHDDNGAVITGSFKQAYSNLNIPTMAKKVNLITVTCKVDQSQLANIYFDTDFKDDYSFVGEIQSPGTLSLWDIALWDTALWDPGQKYTRKVLTVNKLGDYYSLSVEAKTLTESFEYYNSSFAYVGGGYLQ